MSKEEIIKIQNQFVDELWNSLDQESMDRVTKTFALSKSDLREVLFINNRTKRLADNAYINLQFEKLFKNLDYDFVKIKISMHYNTVPKYIKGIENMSEKPYYLGRDIFIFFDEKIKNLKKIFDNDVDQFMSALAQKPTDSR